MRDTWDILKRKAYMRSYMERYWKEHPAAYEHMKQTISKNRRKRILEDPDYRKRLKEKATIYMRGYRKKNGDKIKKNMKIYRAENQEKIRNYGRVWRERDKAKKAFLQEIHEIMKDEL